MRTDTASAEDRGTDRPGDQASPSRPRRHGGVLRVVLLGAIAGLAAAFVLSSLPRAMPAELRGSASWRAGARPAPAFVLRDQDGIAISVSDSKGHVLLMTFLDSHCTKACPVEGRMLRHAVSGLAAGSRPVLMVVSVNPTDTAASARRFVRKARLDGLVEWHWLMGSRASLAPVWSAFGVGVRPTAGDIMHSTALYVIDGHGDERAAFGVPFFPPFVTADVRALEHEAHPRWHWPWS